MYNSKKKVIVFLILLIVLVSSTTTGYNLYRDSKDEERRINEAYNQVYRTYNETVDDLNAFYHSRAKTNIEIPGVIEAFRKQDHKKLYTLMRPQWIAMQRENPWLVVMQFHNADGTSLLRLHQPEVYGDPIALHRPMVAYTHKTQQNVSGFEEGRQGLAYRLMIPIFDRGVYIGAIEFGVSEPYFTDKIHRFAGYESFFFVNKLLLGNFARINDPIEIGHCIGMDIPVQYRPFFREYSKLHSKLENTFFSYSHKTYQVNVLPVKNYASKQVGNILFIRQSDDFKSHTRHTIVASGIIMFGLIVLTVLIVDRIYRYIMTKMSFQERYSQTILDSVPSPVIVTDGETLVAANSSFLSYLDYDTIEHFKKEHACVCEYFEAGDTNEFLMPMHDDQRWTEYMLNHPLKSHKAKMTINGFTTIFEVRISVLKVNDEIRYVVIFNDISVMQMQTMIDPLTKIPNRFHFEMVYEHTIKITQRTNDRLSVIFFDIDHFKNVNDTYGHLVGDTVLQHVSELVSQLIRRSDFFARWGGEEFVILLPDTDLQEAAHVAEMIREKISTTNFKDVGTVTCSFGVVMIDDAESSEHLLNRADELLYEAKYSGRNKVVY